MVENIVGTSAQFVSRIHVHDIPKFCHTFDWLLSASFTLLCVILKSGIYKGENQLGKMLDKKQ